MPDQKDWDRLAGIWHLCEGDGLTGRHLQPFHQSIQKPCLVAGSGLGLIPMALMREGLSAADITCVDFSPAMARAAHARRGIETIVADISDLPFDPACFATVIGASGVLDPRDQAAIRRTAEQISRVLRPDGLWLQAFFDPAPVFRRIAADLGVFEGRAQHPGRLVALWCEREDRDAQAALVGGWTGATSDHAASALTAGDGLLAAWSEVLDQMSAELAHQGTAQPAETLSECFGWTMGSYTGDAALRESLGGLFSIARSVWARKDHLRVVLLKPAKTG